jgi:hypothetical protein
MKRAILIVAALVAQTDSVCVQAGNVSPAERSIRASGYANEFHEYERMVDTVRHGDQDTWERIGILWDHLAAEGCTMAHAIWICPETPSKVRAQLLRLQRKHSG